MTFNTETLLIIFVGLTGFAVLMQACVLLGILISVRKSANLMMDATDELKSRVLPMVQSTQALVDRISPEVVTVTGGLADLTNTLRKETADIHISPAEVINGVKRQVARIDSMLTVGLDRVERAGNALETTVAAPVRQVNGVLAAIRATIDTYRSFPGANGSRRGPQTDASAAPASHKDDGMRSKL